MLPIEEFEIYGKHLTGTETELELEQLMRNRFLKLKMRDRLRAEIGDTEDNITDVMRGVLLCYAVSAGIVSDPVVISRLNNYVTQMIAGYGGALVIMDVLEYDAESIFNHVKNRYFVAKEGVKNAKTREEIMQVDLD